MSKGDVLGFDASRAPKKSSTLRDFGATSAGIQAVFDACDNHDYYNLIEALEPFSPLCRHAVGDIARLSHEQ